MTMDNAHALKQLQSRRRAADADMSIAREEFRLAERRVNDVRSRIKAIEAETLKLTQPHKEVVVSEHAMLRYIERVYGIDLDAIRSEMLTPSALAAIDEFGTGKVPCSGGRLVVKDRVVVTVETA